MIQNRALPAMGTSATLGVRGQQVHESTRAARNKTTHQIDDSRYLHKSGYGTLTIIIDYIYFQWKSCSSLGIFMREIITTITQRSQVTIPAEVRRILGLKPRDKVAFTIREDGVHLTPAPFTLESAYGSVKPDRSPAGGLEEMSRAAKEDKAERTRLELGKP